MLATQSEPCKIKPSNAGQIRDMLLPEYKNQISPHIEKAMPTISVKDAVIFAKNVMVELYHDDPPKNLALEEIELATKDGKEVWEVTLGFYRARSVVVKGNQLSAIFEPQSEIENRAYKIIEIDAETGQFVKMGMRRAP